MNYTLSTGAGPQAKRTLSAGLQKFAPLFAQERKSVTIAALAIMISSGAGLLGPTMIARAIDTAVRLRSTDTLRFDALLLAAVYFIGVLASYFQVVLIGRAAR